MFRALPLLALLLLAQLLSLRASAEETSYLRLRFSTFYLGVAGEVTAGNGTAPIPGGRVFIPPQGIGRLTIGSYYFWGHADLYFTVDLFSFSFSSSPVKQTYTTGFISGFHWYPWALTEGAVRPFIGLGWSPHYYQQTNVNGEGVRDILHRVPLDVGATWIQGRFGVELGLRLMPINNSDYFVSRTVSGALFLPALSGWLGVKFAMGMTPDSEQVSYSERFARRFRWSADAGWYNGLGIALGFAGAFPITSSSWNINERPFLGSRPNSALFPDVGLTFDLHKLKGVINLGYRPIHQTTEAYGLTQELGRDVLALEYDQYLFEFRGFYPFVGAFLSYNWLHDRETDNGTLVIERSETRVRPGVVFGFDFLFSSLEWLVVRTNLRYTPALEIDMPNGKLWYDHLEIDFIQAVFYPSRWWDKLKKKE